MSYLTKAMTVADAIEKLKTLPLDLELVDAGTWWPITDIRQDTYLGTKTQLMCVVEHSYPVKSVISKEQ